MNEWGLYRCVQLRGSSMRKDARASPLFVWWASLHDLSARKFARLRESPKFVPIPATQVEMKTLATLIVEAIILFIAETCRRIWSPPGSLVDSDSTFDTDGVNDSLLPNEHTLSQLPL